VVLPIGGFAGRMRRMNWKDFITVDPAVLVGKPVLKGTRLSV